MKNYKNFSIYDFSDYAEEITGDELFKINGGAEVENSHEGVAGANVGDTITRNDGTVVVLNQGDINYANEQLGKKTNTETGSENKPDLIPNDYGESASQTTDSIPDVPEEIKSNSHALAYYMAKQGQAIAEGNSDKYKGYNVVGTKSNIKELPSTEVVKGKSLSSAFEKTINTISKIFIDDGKEDIYTLGISASGTVTSVSGAIGAGIYINPKSDFRFYQSLFTAIASPSGTKLAALVPQVLKNMDDVGVYVGLETGAGIGQSGAISGCLGRFKSFNDAKGVYTAFGASGGFNGIALGYDHIINLKNEYVGSVISMGLKTVGNAEFHYRLGVTAIKSLSQEN